MIVGDLEFNELEDLLNGKGLKVRFGPFVVRINSNVPSTFPLIHRFYSPYTLLSLDEMDDFHVNIGMAKGLRHWYRRQAVFSVDGRQTFQPCSIEHAFPTLEWGINWCIATRAHHLLMLHSAVVERNGNAILFPAWPGHGKSTLCTALVHSGWRLLSDEFGLVRPEDGLLLPIPRLIPLKIESIDVIRQFSPGAIIGPSFYGTRKGTVAHVRPPEDGIYRMDEPAKPRWLIFPRWIANAPLRIEPIPKSQAFLMVATNSFNYDVLDQTSYRLVTDMVKNCDCHTLVYSDLNEAISAIDELTRNGHG